MKHENVWKLSLLIFCRETVVIVSIVNLSICTSGKAHPPQKKEKKNANELLPLLRSLMLSVNPIRPHFLSLPFPFLSTHTHTHSLSVYERMRRKIIERSSFNANAKKKHANLNQHTQCTHVRKNVFLLKLHPLPLLLSPRPLSPSAPAIVRERTHVRASTRISPAVRARTADGIAAHGAAA